MAGIAIGDGLTDPCTQVQQGPQAAFDFGIINKKTFLKAQQYAAAAGRGIVQCCCLCRYHHYSAMFSVVCIACLEGNYSSAHDFRGLMEDLVQVGVLVIGFFFGGLVRRFCFTLSVTGNKLIVIYWHNRNSRASMCMM